MDTVTPVPPVMEYANLPLFAKPFTKELPSLTFLSGAEGEVVFLTSPESECECADGIARLTVGGGQLLSMIRVYESGERPEA